MFVITRPLVRQRHLTRGTAGIPILYPCSAVSSSWLRGGSVDCTSSGTLLKRVCVSRRRVAIKSATAASQKKLVRGSSGGALVLASSPANFCNKSLGLRIACSHASRYTTWRAGICAFGNWKPSRPGNSRLLSTSPVGRARTCRAELSRSQISIFVCCCTSTEHQSVPVLQARRARVRQGSTWFDDDPTLAVGVSGFGNEQRVVLLFVP